VLYIPAFDLKNDQINVDCLKDLKSGIPQETEMPAPDITTILEELFNAERKSSKEVNLDSCLLLPGSIYLQGVSVPQNTSYPTKIQITKV
jgi:hypothetical protein